MVQNGKKMSNFLRLLLGNGDCDVTETRLELISTSKYIIYVTFRQIGNPNLKLENFGKAYKISNFGLDLKFV